jgi:hypothetical protein
MVNLKKDKNFEQVLVKLLDDFHQGLKKEGYSLDLEKITFAASQDFGPCQCGVEYYYVDKKTNKIKAKCKRC